MQKAENVAIKEFDLAWEEYFRNKPEPKNEKEERKEMEEFYHWYNYVRKQSDTGKTPVEMYKETYGEEPPKEVTKESRMFNLGWDEPDEYEKELEKVAEKMFKEEIWKEAKMEGKNLSKRDLAEMMFTTGFLMHNAFIGEQSKVLEEEMKKDPDGFKKIMEEVLKMKEK